MEIEGVVKDGLIYDIFSSVKATNLALVIACYVPFLLFMLKQMDFQE